MHMAKTGFLMTWLNYELISPISAVLFLTYLTYIFVLQISSLQQVLSAQFSETMMFPMSKALQADLEGKQKKIRDSGGTDKVGI